MRSYGVFSFLAAVLVAVNARTLPYTLNLAHQQVSPDGFRRSAITINGITPGPVLTGNKGDDFSVLVNNNLGDRSMNLTTSIHWHGIFQPRTAYDDGPAMVTQCPIASNQSYQYFVETSDQTGTYWYHSHLGSQYIDGLRGGLVLYDSNDPHQNLYDVDDETTIISLTDWYHNSSLQLGHDWIAGLNPEPIPDSTLLNGVGRYQGGPAIPRSVINVTRGKRYRLRVINMSALLPFTFAIAGHNLTVIEADGVPHQPLEVTSFNISAGQRYSVILNANQPVNNYWIAYPSNLFETQLSCNPNFNGTEAFAILRYNGAPPREPAGLGFVPNRAAELQEFRLRPLVNPPPPTDTPLPLNLNFTTTKPVDDICTPGGGSAWIVNGIQYTSPDVPTLLTILSGTVNQSAGLPPDVYVLPINRTIDVAIFGDVQHPFHLHGHTFQVIQSANGPRNEINPPIRDTVDTNDGFTPETGVVIRFSTNNPGPWFLHCHKDWHLEAGLAVVFAEDPEGMRQTVHPSAAWRQLCTIYNNLPPGDL